jgi:hypothetical protein
VRLVAYGGYFFEGDGFACGLPTGVPILGVEPTLVTRVGAQPVISTTRLTARVISAEFAYVGGALSIEAAFALLWQNLRPWEQTVRQLRGERNDGVDVAIDAILVPLAAASDQLNLWPVQFVSTDLHWRALEQASQSKTFTSALDQAVAVSLTGMQEAPLTVRLQPTAQRASPTAAVGWRYRQTWRIANDGDEPFERLPVRVTIGDTTPLTTTKAQADGDDLIVVDKETGLELARTLDDWDTASSHVWVVVEHLPAGESMDLEIWYGNASAAGPPTLTGGDDLPAFDPAASTNAQWVYQVEETVGDAGLGGWYVSGGGTAEPGVVDHSVPGAWKRAMTLDNPGNRDDAAQAEWTEYTATGTKYHAVFDAQRSRQGGTNPEDNRVADGVKLHHPLGISSVTADIRWQNEGKAGAGTTPVGQVVILTRNSGAERWRKLYSNTAEQASEATIASATYTPSAPVNLLAFAVWPNDGKEVAKGARPNKKIRARWWTTLEVNVPTTDLTISQVGGEEEIYEVAATLRVGGHGTGAQNAPYVEVLLGNARGETGAGTPRLGVGLNQHVVVDMGARSAEVWDSSLLAKQADVPVGLVRAVAGRTVAGSVAEGAAASWPALSPVVQALPNPAFAGNVAGWSAHTTGAGMTVSRVYEGTVFGAAAGSLRHQVTASTAGVGTVADTRADTLESVGGRARVQVAAWVRTSNASLQPQLGILFYRDDGVTQVSTAREDDWTPVANTGYRRVFSAAVPTNATRFRRLLGTKDKAGGQTGSTYFDDTSANGAELIVGDVSPGTVDVDVLWLPVYA